MLSRAWMIRHGRVKYDAWPRAKTTIVRTLAACAALACATLALAGTHGGHGAGDAELLAAASTEAPPMGPHVTNLADPPPVLRERIVGTRRPLDDELVALGFKNVPLHDTIRFIVESTGKTVITPLDDIGDVRITIVTGDAVSRDEAVDILFKAFRIAGVGVVETEDEIILDKIENLTGIQDPGIVLGPDDDVMELLEDGAVVTKIFRVEHAMAGALVERLATLMPPFATYFADENSNQIVLQANVGLAKRVQMLLDGLDHPMYLPIDTRTFRLAHADGERVMEIIESMFEPQGGRGGGGAGQPRPQRPAAGGGANQRVRQPGAQPAPGAVAGGPEEAGKSRQLSTAFLPHINAIVVSAEPHIVDRIAELIEHEWDVPPSTGDDEVMRAYTLKHADPKELKAALKSLLENAGAVEGAGAAFANCYRIEALPATRQLLVVGRTPERLEWFDRIVAVLDAATPVGLPEFRPLRYARAAEVADQLNALLSRAGVGSGIEGDRHGLNMSDIGQDGATGTAGDGGGAQGGDAEGDKFAWQYSGAGNEQSPESSIVGKVRIVPIVRQNALAILGPPDFQRAVMDMVDKLDQPGRQVLITAIVAGVQLRDDFALGLRVGNDGILGGLPDNQIAGSVNASGVDNDFLSGIFDTSILDIGVDATFVLQALAQKTNVKIIQQPKLFVADNTEGAVFIGQQIPFTAVSSQTDTGQINSTFEYQDVGVTLNVLPHITQHREVQLEILLSFSEATGQTLLGGAVINKRNTKTAVTVRDGQTVVLSGIRYESQEDVDRKVPFFGGLPLIGPLFTSTGSNSTVQELIAFVTPIVVENPAANDDNFNIDARRRLDELQRPLDRVVEDETMGTTAPFDPVGSLGRQPATAVASPPPSMGVVAGRKAPSAPGRAKRPASDDDGPRGAMGR